MTERKVFVLHGESGLGVQVDALVESLLNRLAESTSSDIAILRDVQTEIQKLELVAFVTHESAPEISENFQIPTQKGFAAWGESDPSHSWGSISGDIGCASGPDFYTQAEKNFVDWVGHKSWFPLRSDSASLIAVLLRGKEARPFARKELAIAWLTAQELLCAAQDRADHRGFCSAIEQFEFIAKLTTKADLYRALAQCLVSGRGLGWNRCVYYVEELDDPGTLVCTAALGEINKERWANAVMGVEERFGNLGDEVAEAIDPSQSRDLLSKASIGQKLAIPNGSYLSSRPAKAHSDEFPFIKPLDDATIAEMQHARLSLLKGEAAEYLPDSNVFFFPIDSASGRCFCLLSQPYTVEPPSPVFTTIFLEYATHAIDLLNETQSASSEPPIESIDDALATRGTIGNDITEELELRLKELRNKRN